MPQEKHLSEQGPWQWWPGYWRAPVTFLIFIFTLFCFTMLYWFCHTLTWISHGCTWVPNPEHPSHLPRHIISLDHPHAPAPSILYPVLNIDWWFVSYMIVYMFQCHLTSEESASSFKLCNLVSYREDFNKAWLEILETSQTFSRYMSSLTSVFLVCFFICVVFLCLLIIF